MMKGAISLFLVFFITLTLVTALDYTKMESAMSTKYGAEGLERLKAWSVLMNNLKTENTDAATKVDRINEFFNRQVTWGSDAKVWGDKDYWATPIETMGKAAGDCEDFSIAKYYSLLNSGVAIKQLRLVYVKAKTNSGVQAHMVLAYYPTPDAEPLILDNLVTSIRPASRRKDLSPVFSFNGEGVFSGTSSESKGGTEKLSRWQDLMKRTKNEGF